MNTKNPIYINADKLSGYIGLKCSNSKIICSYMNGNKEEKRPYHDKVISFTFEDMILKAKIVDYKRGTIQALPIKAKLKEIDLKAIKALLLKQLK